MSGDNNHKIVGFKTYIYILIALIVLTGISIVVTSIDVGNIGVFVALFLASIKSTLVLGYFMHLIFDKRIYTLLVGLVILVLTIVLIITFLDYTYR